jgi:hypothetical protein
LKSRLYDDNVNHIVTRVSDYRRGLDWFHCTLYIHNSGLHTFQLTFTHALRFSVFTSRILATDLSQSHCHFKTHMKSSWHSIIPFLSLFYSCKFRKLDSLLSTTVLYSFAYYDCVLLQPFGKDHTENTAPIFKEVCLLRRYLAIDVLL